MHAVCGGGAPSFPFVTTHDIKVQNAWHGNLQPPSTAFNRLPPACLPAPEPAIVQCNHNQARFDPGCKVAAHFVSHSLRKNKVENPFNGSSAHIPTILGSYGLRANYNNYIYTMTRWAPLPLCAISPLTTPLVYRENVHLATENVQRTEGKGREKRGGELESE